MRKKSIYYLTICIILLKVFIFPIDIWSMPAQEVISEATINDENIYQDPYLDDSWDDPENWRDMEIAAASLTTFSDFSHRSDNQGVIRKGIDVSSHQGNIDWSSVASSGIDFAIIRGAYRGYGSAGNLREDPMFVQNITEAKAAGLKVGAYIYSQAITIDEGREEANFLLDIVRGYQIDLPLVIDFEYYTEGGVAVGRLKPSLGQRTSTDICNEFCRIVENAGYSSMVYANKSTLTNNLYASEFGRVWLAQYNSYASYGGAYEYWQCSSSGDVDGISGSVDLDFWYDTGSDGNLAPETQLDGIDGGIGTFSVSGWAFDPDDPSRTLDVHVYLKAEDGQMYGIGVLQADQERTDVHNAYGCGTNHGFSGTLTSNGLYGTFTPMTAALDLTTGGGGAVWRERGTVLIEDPADYNPRMNLDSVTSDSAGQISIRGWAFDPDDTGKALNVHVYNRAGEWIGATVADKTRTDVNKTYGCGDNHGFEATFTTTLTGEQTVDVYALNTGNGSDHARMDRTVSIREGSRMETGCDRELPDGDYIIATACSSNKGELYYLDINGAELSASNGTNVMLHGPVSGLGDISAYDAWTVSYNDGFYSIMQKGADVALDVADASKANGGNVQVYAANGSDAQKWAVSKNGSNGYRLQAKCSGLSLDTAGAVAASGTNVQQHINNDTAAQGWLFIPYKPSQPVENGRYVLLSGVDNSKELDVPGNTGDIADQTAIQIWNDGCPSKYNSFDITKLSNGYYKLIHHASGKAVEVMGGTSDRTARVALKADNGSLAQQWAIMNDGNGGYTLKVRSSGYAMDLAGANTADGSPVRQYYYNGSKAESWKFVKAEYDVSYNANANGATGLPSAQTKYYKEKLTISSDKPILDGFQFSRWHVLYEDGSDEYILPGGSYIKDAASSLWAVWTNTITYDLNGGKGKIEPTVKQKDKTVNLTTAIPALEDAVFLGWAKTPGAETAQYKPGEAYDNNGDLTLYAVWCKPDCILPEDLKAIHDEAFASCGFKYIKIGSLVETIGDRGFADCKNLKYIYIPENTTSISDSAFQNISGLTIIGKKGSYAEEYAGKHGFRFIMN